jgi:alpha-amylase/alpha-mannosidase (GH57 family)
MTVLTEQTDEISDGSQQFYYENNSLCMWQVIPPNASTLTLNFTKFQTEEDTDVLNIYDLSNNALLAQLSGIYDPPNLPLPVTSPSGKMFITFTTNGTTRADGWEAWYETDLVEIEEITNGFNVEVYPNPASETINISINQDLSSALNIELCNYLGQSVVNRTITKSGDNQLNVSSIPEGLYLLKIHNQEMSNISKIVISR